MICARHQLGTKEQLGFEPSSEVTGNKGPVAPLETACPQLASAFPLTTASAAVASCPQHLREQLVFTVAQSSI